MTNTAVVVAAGKGSVVANWTSSVVWSGKIGAADSTVVAINYTTLVAGYWRNEKVTPTDDWSAACTAAQLLESKSLVRDGVLLLRTAPMDDVAVDAMNEKL